MSSLQAHCDNDDVVVVADGESAPQAPAPAKKRGRPVRKAADAEVAPANNNNSAGPIISAGAVEKLFKNAMVAADRASGNGGSSNAKAPNLSKEAKVAVVRAANVAAIMTGSLVADQLAGLRSKRVTNQHVYTALSSAGFEHLVPICKAYVGDNDDDSARSGRDSDSDEKGNVVSGKRRGRELR
jgi:hypothetical protein